MINLAWIRRILNETPNAYNPLKHAKQDLLTLVSEINIRRKLLTSFTPYLKCHAHPT